MPKHDDAFKSENALPNDFFDNSPKPERKGILKNAQPPKSILKNSSVPKGTIVASKEHLPEKEITLSNNQPGLPSDFFDQGVNSGSSATTDKSAPIKEGDEKGKKRKLSSTSEQLPEGFFDDPKKDAKARNVEYKDPKDEEWEKFQKIIQEETKIAENIQDEEDEESEMLKDMDELNNMKSCLSRVDRLKKMINKKKEEKVSVSKDASDKMEEGDESESSGDEDVDEMFNWRAKMA